MKRWKLVVVLLVIITLSSPFLFDYILKAKQNHFIRRYLLALMKKKFKVVERNRLITEVFMEMELTF